MNILGSGFLSSFISIWISELGDKVLISFLIQDFYFSDCHVFEV